MTLWKKVTSTAMSATLIASLLASAFAGSVSAAATTYLATCLPASCSQVADGNSFIKVLGPTVAITSGLGFMTIAGGSFVAPSPTSDGGDFTFTSAGRIDFVSGATIDAADKVWVSATAAGTATITVWTFNISNQAVVNGTFDLTFYAASALDVSVANSSVKLVTFSGGVCTTTAWDGTASSSASSTTPVGCVTVTVKNGNNDPVSGSVSVTLQPYGLVSTATDGTLKAQSTSGTLSVSGAVTFAVYASGLAGASTLSVSVTDSFSKTTSLGTKAITFAGPLATLTLTNAKYTGVDSTATINALKLVGKDAQGNIASVGSLTWTSSPSSPALAAPVAGSKASHYDVTCSAGGAEVAYTISVKSGTIASGSVKFYCNVDVTDKVVVTPKDAAIAAGGTTTFTATVTDASGNPVADSTSVTAIASAGVAIGDGSLSSYQASSTLGGIATFTYFAQNTTGPVTLTAIAGGLSGSASVTVGGAGVLTGTAASAVGVTVSGPFSATTKVVGVGKYVTIKFAFGSAGAGKSVVIQSATKSSSGVWSAFSNVTTRVADGSGNVYYYARSSSIAWKSFRVIGTNAVQARWT